VATDALRTASSPMTVGPYPLKYMTEYGIILILLVVIVSSVILRRIFKESQWEPLLELGDLQISLYADDTLEIRDGQVVYVHLTKEETEAFLQWLDSRA